MGQIIVLDENTSNKIAAGEVVEKPASVVKELVENSIDAGATSISIDIKNGGISYIKVTDNGSGMDEDDVEIAFERHATSKIKKAEDLDSIITMGFRGEALASIAAVSSVELQTRTAQNTYGMYVHISGGAVKEVRQTGCPVGTTFIVKDLFYNTPARYKFLKKDSAEAGYISDTISRIALGNPGIAFRLMSGKTQLLHTPGNDDIKSAVYSIYGREIISELMQVDYQDEKYRITGYVGKPEAARANRNYQSLYINKRYVKSKLVSYAVEQAYASILMKNKFPFFVLNIELNPLLVDANVHPAKMDVRFAEESYLSRAIYMAVSKALSSDSLFNPVTVSNKDRELFRFKDTGPQKEYIQFKIQETESRLQKEIGTRDTGAQKKYGIQDAEAQDIKPEPGEGEGAVIQDTEIREKAGIQEYMDSRKDTEVQGPKPKSVIQDAGTRARKPEAGTYGSGEAGTYDMGSASRISEDKEIRRFTEALKPLAGMAVDSGSSQAAQPMRDVAIPPAMEEENSDLSYPAQKPKDMELTEMKYIGQAFSTFIILQNGEELVMVDQHAAHERILYEKLKIKYEAQENTTQLLLEPVVVQLQAIELNAIKAKREMFNKIGYSFEDFGNNSIIIRGIPYMVEGYSPKEVFLELADKLQEAVKPVSTPLADEIIHTIACKAAIKANKKLDEREVRQLLEELSNTGSRYTCPHGRPTVIRLTKYEIEKMFKRIV